LVAELVFALIALPYLCFLCYLLAVVARAQQLSQFLLVFVHFPHLCLQIVGCTRYIFLGVWRRLPVDHFPEFLLEVFLVHGHEVVVSGVQGHIGSDFSWDGISEGLNHIFHVTVGISKLIDHLFNSQATFLNHLFADLL
jgi:hypothetical protein